MRTWPRRPSRPRSVPFGTLVPDMVRLDAETKQIAHAIRMAAYNAQPSDPRPGRPLRPRRRRGLRADPRGFDHLRRHLPGPGGLLTRLDPLTAPWPTRALAALCDQLTAVGAWY